MSRKTRSGRSRRMIVTASLPLPHSPMTSMSGACLSRMRMPSRASGSSSTIKARIFSTCLSLRLDFNEGFSVKRKRGGDDQTAFFGIAHFKAAARAIQIFQARARIRKADAFDQVAVRHVQTRTIVAHLKTEQTVLTLSANVNHSARVALGDAVANGVFHQRLKEKLRHQRVERRRVNLPPDRQTILKTYL